MKRVHRFTVMNFILEYIFSRYTTVSIRRWAKFRRERQFRGETSSCRSTMRRKVGIEDEEVLALMRKSGEQ